tara:strand:+ start:1497 stop:1910 length:414 start_codon:yes stop_codon:yes gene_type:complete
MFKQELKLNKLFRIFAQFTFVIVLDAMVIAIIYQAAEEKKITQAIAKEELAKPVVMIDPKTGLTLNPRTKLIMGKGYPVVERECAQCHPTQIIRSYRANRTQWLDAIRWMQAEKGLKSFDRKTEETILTYLVTYYGR